MYFYLPYSKPKWQDLSIHQNSAIQWVKDRDFSCDGESRTQMHQSVENIPNYFEQTEKDQEKK